MGKLKFCPLVLFVFTILMSSFKLTSGEQGIFQSHVPGLPGLDRRIDPLEQLSDNVHLRQILSEKFVNLSILIGQNLVPTPSTPPLVTGLGPPPQLEKISTICEWEDPPSLTGSLNTINLKCQNGNMKIKSAFYGREDRNTCVPSGVDSSKFNISCSSDTALSKVKQLCEGKQSCTVAATNRNFGDPCPRTWKYLTVSYSCQGIQLYQFNDHGEIECKTNEDCPGAATDPGCDFIEDDGRKIYHCWHHRNTSYCGNLSSQKTDGTICVDISGERASNCYIDPVTKTKHAQCDRCMVKTQFSSRNFKKNHCKAGGKPLSHISAIGGQDLLRSTNPNRACPHGSCRRKKKCCRVIPYRRTFLCPHHC